MDLETEEAMLLYLLSERLKNKKKSSSSKTTIGEMLLQELKRNAKPKNSIKKQLVPKTLEKKMSPKNSIGKIKKKLKEPNKRKKRVWSIGIQNYNVEDGFFKKFYQELRKDEDKFFDYLRMSIASFDELFGYLNDHIKKQNTRLRICVSPVERLVVTLRYLATGCSLSQLHSIFGVGQSTASNIIRQVTFYIWEVLAEQEIPPLNRQLFLEISRGFQEKVDFPHCIGAIDGKHIKMSQTDSSGFSSVVLMAMCDSDFKFTHIEVVPYGDASDTKIFNNSVLHDKLLKRSLDIPPPSQLGDEEELCPYVILGAKGFSMSQNLLKSYGGKDPSDVKKNFNRRVSQARQCIDSTFEMLTNKWQVFQSPLNVRYSMAENVVKAACVLHNFVLRRDGPRNEIGGEPPKSTALFDIDDCKSRVNLTVLNVRERFAEFFAKNSLEK